MDWYETYLKDIKKKTTIDSYINNKIKSKKKLIDLIRKYAKIKVLEAGSGTGIISSYLASIGYDVIGIDIDDKMIELSNKFGDNISKTSKPRFIKKSIFDLNFKKNEFDVSFSNGVLEHFSDSMIISTLSRQMDIAKIVIFGIPTKYFNKEESMYGDERYMNIGCWRELIKKSGGTILEEKSMHYKKIYERIIDCRKWFRPYPYRIFVIRKDK